MQVSFETPLAKELALNRSVSIGEIIKNGLNFLFSKLSEVGSIDITVANLNFISLKITGGDCL